MYDRYLSALQERLPDRQATREFVRILRLHEEYSEAVITQALQKALECHCYSSDGVKQLVMGFTELDGHNRPAVALTNRTDEEDSVAVSSVSMRSVAWPEVSEYNHLLHNSIDDSGGDDV